MTDRGSMTDDDLLRRSTAGDEASFVELYRRRQATIHRFASQLSGQPDWAEEVTQETFLALIREGNRYDPARGTVLSWLFGIARNLMLRRLERERRFVQIDGDTSDPPAGDDPLGDLTRGESLEALRQAVLTLPLQYREAVVLCDLQEASYEEAAQALSCAVGTVRSRLHRGRALLAQRLRTMARCKQ